MCSFCKIIHEDKKAIIYLLTCVWSHFDITQIITIYTGKYFWQFNLLVVVVVVGGGGGAADIFDGFLSHTFL